MDNRKIINAWCMYDWANSAYNLVITTTFFPIYFSGITTAAYGDRVPFLGRTFKASALYDYALAFAYLAIAVLLPILSSFATSAATRSGLFRSFSISGGCPATGCFGLKVLKLIVAWGLSVLF